MLYCCDLVSRCWRRHKKYNETVDSVTTKIVRAVEFKMTSGRIPSPTLPLKCVNSVFDRLYILGVVTTFLAVPKSSEFMSKNIENKTLKKYLIKFGATLAE